VAKATRRFLARHRPPHGRLRFDLVGITIAGRWRWSAEWRKDVFDETGRLR